MMNTPGTTLTRYSLSPKRLGVQLLLLIMWSGLLTACATQMPQDKKADSVDSKPGEEVSVSKAPSMQEIKSHVIKKEFAKAEAKLRLRLSRNSEDAIALANLGVVLSELGRQQEAMKMLRKAIELNEDLIPAYVRLASIIRQQGEIKEAVALNQKALDIDPDYANAHYNLAILYDLYLQQPGQALTHLESYMGIVGKVDRRDESWKKQLQRKMKSRRDGDGSDVAGNAASKTVANNK